MTERGLSVDAHGTRAADGRRDRRQRRLASPLRRWGWLAALFGVVAAAGVIAYVVTPRPGAVIAQSAGPTVLQRSGPGVGLPKLASGVRAPNFSLPRLGGGARVSLDADRGHPVVLNFFASWCRDCRAELGAFAKVSAAFGSRVRFLGIDTSDHNFATARSLLRSAGDRYPVGIDPSAAVANARYYVQALPVTVFIDARGKIVGEVFGAQSATSLARHVRALLGRTAQGGGRS
ncbi:MAG: TlpA disulfide reductase family protein [Actinomycetota bacterium]|nr:TlpA disulfide reductase family protein [Actinomycetota bacterium]